MNGLALLHRRLTLLMALAALAAFAAGAALPLSALIATGAALVVGIAYQPPEELSERIERIVLIVAAALIVWALYQVFVITDDVVAPVVALLLVLLAGEALRSLEAHNDARLYTLSLALLVASTAYLPGVAFAAAFIAFVILGTLSLMIGHLRRQAEQHDAAAAPIGRPFLGATAALSIVILLMAALVFLAFPRLPRNLLGRGLDVAGMTMAGFSREVSLAEHGARIYPNPQVVLRVEFPELPEGAVPVPQQGGSFHWRGRSYDSFDGIRWSRNVRRIGRAWAPRDWYASWTAAGAEDGWLRQRVYGGALDANAMFGLHPMMSVQPSSAIRPILDPVGDFAYVGSAAPIYEVRSITARPDPERLRAAVPGPNPMSGAPGTPAMRALGRTVLRHYLPLPPLSSRVHALAERIVAGHGTQYDRVVAVERWLESNLEYTLELPSTAEEATLESFLFDRRAGHCEYFSTAMAVLLRTQGIPTRNVNGFLGGQWNEFGRYLAVTQNDAHSWVEVWFPGVGWVAFDPTPGAAGGGGPARESGLGSLRFLFDGLQHRWSKWVIDYSLDKQIALFGQVGDLLSRDRQRAAEGQGERERGWVGPLLFVIGGLAALWLALRLARRPWRSGVSDVSRVYLALRRSYARRGWGRDSASNTALTWLDGIERQGAPASGQARQLVDAYLAARFGERDGDVDALRTRLREIRQTLRERARG